MFFISFNPENAYIQKDPYCQGPHHIISVIVAGVGLLFLNPALGSVFAACGILMLLLYRKGYRCGDGPVLTRKFVELEASSRQEVLDFIEGRRQSIRLKSAGQGAVIRLDVYFCQRDGQTLTRFYSGMFPCLREGELAPGLFLGLSDNARMM